MKNLPALLSLLAVLAMASCKAGAPGKIQSSVATGFKQKITVGGREWKNPTPDTEASVKQGAEHFQHHCMVCHGLDGHYTGVPFAQKMDPPVPDLGSKDVQDYADGQLKWIIENGIGPSGMPAWKGILEEEEMWHVVRYIRHLPPKGSLGVPAVYQESAEEHEHMEMGATPAEKPDQSKPHTHTHEHKH